MTRLDELLEPYTPNPNVHKDPRVDIQAAIREAYRIGHDDGRMARLPQGEETFIDRLRKEQEASSGEVA